MGRSTTQLYGSTLAAWGVFALLASATPSVVAGGTSESPKSAGGDCSLRCDDLDYAARRTERECEAPIGSNAKEECAAARKEIARATKVLGDECPCVALGEERRRERRIGVGVAFSVPSYFPRLTTELNLFEGKWTIGAVFGVGRAATRDPSTDLPTSSVWAYELGAQLRGYVYGTFTHGGVAVGVQVLYARAQVEDLRLGRGQVVPGVMAGPFAAVRIPDFPIIHTVELTAGVGFVVYDKREGGGGRVTPIGSLGFGWTF